MSKKHDPKLMEFLLNHTDLNVETGNVRFREIYTSTYVNICWKGSVVSVPLSHVVWLLTRMQWPPEGYVIDHVNDDPMDNRPTNLKAITQAENQEKRRGRVVYRSYGKGKYGPGMCIYRDKRDRRYYVTHQPSRGHGKGDLKNVKISLGGFDTREQAEQKVHAFLIEKGLV